jgi:uncharacterized membrane protein YeaQ/YmgE (transglycosylase-associated protein family)
MTFLGVLLLLIIAAICGAIAQALVGYSPAGCLLSSVIGIIGAFLGFWIAQWLSLPLPLTITIQGEPFPILWSIIGSVIFVGVLSIIRGASRRA